MEIKKEKTIKDFIDMEQLELKYYSEEHVTPHEDAYLWHLSNPMTGFVLEDSGTIIAFSDILPINQDLYERILSGTFNDKYLTAGDLIRMETLKEGDSLNLLLSCVVVHEDYRKTDALKTLLNAHMDYYRDFAAKGIQIEYVITSNVTKEGERFSERMGFDRVGRTEHQTTLYRTSFRQFDEKVKNLVPKLETMLLQYEKDLTDPGYCSDRERLKERLALNFMEYGQSGLIYSRERMLEILENKKDSNVIIGEFSMKCLSPQTAVIHYIASDQRNPERKSLRTSIWIVEDKKWKLFFHQGTEMK